jgi:predicted DNA-binding transcriptional regulator AlpA
MDKIKTTEEIPMLIPYQPSEFWAEFRKIIQEEVASKISKRRGSQSKLMQVDGMTERPLYKIIEVCQLFDVSRTTIHEWVKSGQLRKIKVKSRVYFLGADIQKILAATSQTTE